MNEGKSVLATATAKIVNANPFNNSIRALCDTGSQLNLITARATRKLGLTPDKFSITVQGMKDTPIERTMGRVALQLHLTDNDEIFTTIFHVVSEISRNMPEFIVDMAQYQEFKNLPLADPQYGIPNEIEALFGIQVIVKILNDELIKSQNQAAMAQSTRLGWIIYQIHPIESLEETPYSFFLTPKNLHRYEELQQTLKNFWQLEEVPNIKPMNPDHKLCENFFVETHTRNENGRYVVKMPLNEKIEGLGHSKLSAIKQFLATERKMERIPQFKKEYIQFMTDFESLDHMSKINHDHEEGYYTPHHGVNSSSKFRVVFNSSFPTTTGISLNDCQLVGPKLQQDLANLLMRFRTFEYVLTADVVKMFRQVEIHPDDRKYQKIIWRYSPKDPLTVYQLNRVAYGQASAPYMSVRAMQQCAHDYTNEFPIGAYHVLTAFYVDDLITGADTFEELLEIKYQITQLLAKGKFELAKWCSNTSSSELNDHLNDKPKEKIFENSILGLKWQSQDDVFLYSSKPINFQTKWTKRQILSQIGKLFDPNGYVGPVLIKAKILLQKIWKVKIDWDDEVPQSINNEWTEYLTNLNDINIQVPRWLGTNIKFSTELHGFCDASERAYAAVVYARTVSDQNNVQINLIQCKTKVSPLKFHTIPRLELLGATLLADLFTNVKTILTKNITKSYLWTDSEIVIKWLAKPSEQLKVFVANRVEKIHEATVDSEWNWIAGKQNPADLASRGVTPQQLQQNSLWWHGPEWLSMNKECWPINNPISNDDIDSEMKAITFVIRKFEPIMRGPWFKARLRNVILPFIESYSDLNSLQNAMIIVLRAIINFKAKGKSHMKKFGPITSEEREEALIKLVQIDQKCHLRKEFQLAKVSRDNSLKIDPVTKTLRYDGRVQSENLNYDERNPIFLPYRSHLARLIIKQGHQKTLHGGVQQVLHLIRQKFWIPKARILVRSAIHWCITCLRHKMKPQTQFMSQLPRDRSTPTKPFTVCGVDYMGPVGLIVHRARGIIPVKAYVCVFVCFATRAIHVELVSNQSTNQFIAALRRMIARRGQIHTIWSDNGTNFVGANSFLKQIYAKNQEWSETIPKQMGIKWNFIAPHSPHHGGLHEAAVKSVKTHLKKVIGNQNLTFEEYSTLLTQVEACVNSRPIAPLSDDPNDLTALTPSHFLIGENLITLQEPRNLDDVRQNRLDRWELVQQMYQHLWERWHSEYIMTLRQRVKWTKESHNLNINDLVILKEDNQPPSRWQLARVVEVHPGKDGLVRIVKVKTPTGIYERPITKLGLIPK